MPKVSVIIPNYNHAPFLRQRIESVLNQTYQDFEVILMDDKSIDNSLEIINSYQNHPKIKDIIINSVNSGSTFKQWNKGIKSSKGEYIWIAESDDYSSSIFLETLVPVLEQDKNVGVAFSQSYKVNEKGTVLGLGTEGLDLESSEFSWDKDFCLESPNVSISIFLKFCLIYNASSALIRKELFDKIQGVDENFKLTGDLHFWIRLSTISTLYYSHYPNNYFRFHENTVRKSSQKLGIESYEFFKVYLYIYNHIDILSAQNKANVKGYIRKYLYLSLYHLSKITFIQKISLFKGILLSSPILLFEVIYTRLLRGWKK